MARSLKKDHLLMDNLMKKVEALNAAGKKKLSKLGLDVQQSSLNLLSIHLQCITEENISQFM